MNTFKSDCESHDFGRSTRGLSISSGSRNMEVTSSSWRRKEILRRTQANKPFSSKYVIDLTGSDGASVPRNDTRQKNKGKIQLKSTPRVRCHPDNFGINCEDMDTDKTVMDKTEKAQFRRMAHCVKSERSTREELDEGDDDEDMDSEDSKDTNSEDSNDTDSEDNEMDSEAIEEMDSKDNEEIDSEDSEDMDSDNSGIKIIEKSEFRKLKVNGGCFVAPPVKNFSDGSRKISSAGQMGENEKKISVPSNSRRDDEISSCAPATRTRSKTANAIMNKYQHKVDRVPFDLSDESSSSTDSGNTIIADDNEVENSNYSENESSSSSGSEYNSMSDDIEAENSDLSESSESSWCSYEEEEEYEVQNDKMMGISTKNSEGCSKKEGRAMKRASNQRVVPNCHREAQEKCDGPDMGRLGVSWGKRKVSSDASTRGSEEGKSYQRNGVTNTVPDDEANAYKDLGQRSNGKSFSLPESSCSKKPFTPKDTNGDEEKNGLRSRAGVKMQTEMVSPTHSKDEDCASSDHQVHSKPDAPSLDKANEVPGSQIKRKRGFSEQYDLCQKLADSILGRGSNEEHAAEFIRQTRANPIQNSLPVKCRFEDEVPKQAEKTDFEKEMDDMWAEASLIWDMDYYNGPEVDHDPKDSSVQETKDSSVQEAQDVRCARGEHDLVVRDDAGSICKCCLHVELHPKDIMPEWAEKTRRDSRRVRSSRIEELSQFDNLNLASPIKKCSAFDSDDGTVWNIKPGVRGSMYEHQQEGFEFLWMNLAGSINLSDVKSPDPSKVGGCIISHAPGTGKTRLTMVFIETYFKLFPNCRPVIIAPAGMLLTWEEEFKKWDIDFPFYNLNNLELGEWSRPLAVTKRPTQDEIRMMKIYMWNLGEGILGISYSLFEKLTGEKYMNEKKKNRRRAVIDKKTEVLREILLKKPGLVVLDEGHYPRNKRSNIWNALLKLQTDKRIILSGTPFQNNCSELFNTLCLVRPTVAERMPSSIKFNASASIADSDAEKLKDAMSPFVHVHKGTILQERLPGLRDCVIILKPPALQKSLLESLLKKLKGSQNTFENEHRVALISMHPYLLTYHEKHRPCMEQEKVLQESKLNPSEGAKTKFIVELVHLSMAMNEKVLVFSQYIQPLELLKEQLKEIFKWIEGKQILRMEGGMMQKQRQILINTFNDPHSDAKIMLASTKCCSEGISLVGASRVVLLDVVWNPSVERQAICRAYRIGQKRFVHAYHLMTCGTNEDGKYSRQAAKERLSELVFCSSSNESKEQRTAVIEDRILEEMISNVKLKDMFEMIINQPKDTDLIRTFGLTA